MTGALQAVLFDMDGTVADTEALWVSAKAAVAHAHGIPWTEEDAHWAMGKPTPVYAGEFVRRGARGSVAELADEITAHVAAAVADDVVWMPGARQLLRALAEAEIPTALVTMAYRPVAEAVARATGLPVFQEIVAGDDVVHSKPHPEPYLTALRRLAERGVDPAGCVAVEDTVTGATSAESAGIRTLLVPSPHDRSLGLGPVAGRTIRPSLVGISPADLAALV
ncbi:HAD family phosphatase [Microbacterium sp. SLBN-146]|uniref:HAD family hydrolase n=1 Tax=Microbacterium sp. SLBN-146 TaxID=2768457 RepID=UPI001151D61D|nr:HAD family phosphatase [Microbacterium sp. SLBN-146]TQJ29887.1 HAD superfamily hydrolase (TIGR01509 family) [Microbacterium sp. SLBN-146]